MADKENVAPIQSPRQSRGQMSKRATDAPAGGQSSKRQKEQASLNSRTVGSVLEEGHSLMDYIDGGCAELKPSIPVTELKDVLLRMQRSRYQEWTLEQLQYLVSYVCPAISVKANGDLEGMRAFEAVSREANKFIAEVPNGREILDPTYLLVDTAGAVPAALTAVINNWPPVDAVNATRYHSQVMFSPGSTRLLRIHHANQDQLDMDRHALAAMLIQAGATSMFVWHTALPVQDYP